MKWRRRIDVVFVLDKARVELAPVLLPAELKV
jgi:hypothetical protein